MKHLLFSLVYFHELQQCLENGFLCHSKPPVNHSNGWDRGTKQIYPFSRLSCQQIKRSQTIETRSRDLVVNWGYAQ